MKKVVFICLLSLSTCLSRPDGTQATPAPMSTNDATPAKNHSTPAGEVNGQPHADTLNATQNASITPDPAAASKQPQAANEGTMPSTSNHTTAPTTTNTTKPEIDANETNDKKSSANKDETTTVGPSKGLKPETTPQPNPRKTDNATTPANKDDKTTVTTTLKPEPTPKPTETPKAADTPTLQARGFDGPSFIGGIILTLGLLAIGFMGFKYYKNQTERNYHTL